VLGSGTDFRLTLLDLAAGAATDVATIHVAGAFHTDAQPYVSVSASADGSVVLLALNVPDRDGAVFLVRPDAAQATSIVGGTSLTAVVSGDGRMLAVGRSSGPATGLWIGPTGGTLRRLIADDPSAVGSPPTPFAFSPDDSLVAVGIGAGDTGPSAVVVQTNAAEARVDRLTGAARLAGAAMTDTSGVRGAAFFDDRQLFVWSSRGAFGGNAGVFSYDVRAQRTVAVYRPGADSAIAYAAARPGTDQFATIEGEPFRFADLTGWLRGRDGSARSLGDLGALVGEVWWSPDGSKLYEIVGGDDSVGGVRELVTGRGGMAFCKRGGGPPPAPCT
jgi:hypothetical protein